MRQNIRIIGGQYRGKKVTFPDVESLRPTPDRVRETLFNWLMHDIHDAVCLDAFAGSGALGLEAYSRGAKTVFFIEKNIKVYQHLQKTLEQFNNPLSKPGRSNEKALHLILADAHDFFLSASTVFDIVFLDPPFSENKVESYLNDLLIYQLINGGLVYVESKEGISPNPDEWQILKQKQSGAVFYSLLRHISK